MEYRLNWFQVNYTESGTMVRANVHTKYGEAWVATPGDVSVDIGASASPSESYVLTNLNAAYPGIATVAVVPKPAPEVAE